MLILGAKTYAFPNMLILLMGSMDCITTVIGITYFSAIECNPMMSSLISSNIIVFIAIKMVSTLIVCQIFNQANKILTKSQNRTSKTFIATKTLLKVTVIGVIAFLSIVVLNNLVILARAF
ncbi:MAG: hypothetical protein GX638_16625 [Crenarchaeota archaeon]|nr:hypothetical protein [Thermoproteota archaeon]